jgi:2-dehydropantoate 2-reductase
MRIVVAGAGGVGGYFGGRLAASGADVTFIARGRHLEALRRNGLKILSPRGDALVPNVKAVETIGEVQGADLVMVCVKLWDTEGVAAELGPSARNGAAIVSFQNGVEKDEVLGRHVPREAIIGGLCYIAASITEPGVIGHTGALQKLVFGEFDGKRSERCEAFLAACGQADVDAEIAGSIERLIWEKFVFSRRPLGNDLTVPLDDRPDPGGPREKNAALRNLDGGRCGRPRQGRTIGGELCRRRARLR